MSIASKEKQETKYWINLLIATSYINSEDKTVILVKNQIDEIIELLTSVVLAKIMGSRK